MEPARATPAETAKAQKKWPVALTTKPVMAGDPFGVEAGLLREWLARATLLGLEFLVAADIIATVAAVPTLSRLSMLTGIILLRSFLSATLFLEVEGRWPWMALRREADAVPFSAHG